MHVQFWRKWHRWIGFAASIFLLFAATTGVTVAVTEFFGEAERTREANRKLISAVTLESSPAWFAQVRTAMEGAASRGGNAPLDRITIEFKGERPKISIYTGRPQGGEGSRYVFDARTGAPIGVESYVDKPFLYRLHSGEAFGDGGLFLAMFWGLCLIVMTITGLVIYLRMRRANQSGLKRVFW